MDKVANPDSTKIKSIVKIKKYSDLVVYMYSNLAKNGSIDIDFIANQYLTEPELIRLPAYAVTVSYTAKWSASFGYTRTEHYTEYVKVHKDGHSYTEPRTRTKKVTDWRPASGNDGGRFTLLCYAGTKHSYAKNLMPAFSKIGATKLIDQASLSENKFIEISGLIKGHNDTINYNISESVKENRKGDTQKDWLIYSDHEYECDKYSFAIYSGHIFYKGKKKKIYFSTTSEGRYIFDKFDKEEVDNTFEDLSKKLRITIVVGTAIISIASSNYSFFAIVIATGFWFYAKSCSNSIKTSYTQKIDSALENRIQLGFIGASTTIPNYHGGPEVEWQTPKGKQKFVYITATTAMFILLLTFKDFILHLVAGR